MQMPLVGLGKLMSFEECMLSHILPAAALFAPNHYCLHSLKPNATLHAASRPHITLMLQELQPAARAVVGAAQGAQSPAHHARLGAGAARHYPQPPTHNQGERQQCFSARIACAASQSSNQVKLSMARLKTVGRCCAAACILFALLMQPADPV
jgi:hypothetical protein